VFSVLAEGAAGWWANRFEMMTVKPQAIVAMLLNC